MVWQRSHSPILTQPYPSIIWPLARSTSPSLPSSAESPSVSDAASQSTSNIESGASPPGTGSPGASNAEPQKQVQQCKWCLVSGRAISWCNQSLAYTTKRGSVSRCRELAQPLSSQARAIALDVAVVLDFCWLESGLPSLARAVMASNNGIQHGIQAQMAETWPSSWTKCIYDMIW